MKYKFITIEESRISAGRPEYRITNNKSGDILGYVVYYPTWRQYVFSQADEGMVFNNTCLRDVVDFMENRAGKEA